MKYTCEVWIDLPRDKVISLFDNKDNLFTWEEGLKSFDIISGSHGTEGFKYKLVYNRNDREMVRVTTIENYDFPGKMIAIHEEKNIWNRCINIYEEHDNKTLWQIENEFIGSGIMKVMMSVRKKLFIKETLLYMNRFKKFAEKQ